MTPALFADDAPNAIRQPKSDRLILQRFLKDAAGTHTFRGEDITAAHEILIRWADLESSGRLDSMRETQLQGEFLSDVFDKALGYTPFSAGLNSWTRMQHEPIAGETPDAILGRFTSDKDHKPLAVVELKGPRGHLDRDRNNGRTAVQQLWDYLNNTDRECRWGIVSNIISFRLYERDSTKTKYEHFTLQSLRDPATFQQFHYLLGRLGLVEGIGRQPPRAVELLKRTNEQQRKVGDELYDLYSRNRLELIRVLREQGHSTDLAIEMAQRLFDRIIFIAFCEDRDLLNGDTIQKAYRVNGFQDVTNPRWKSFKSLFRFIHVGHPEHHIPPYNGGLFAKHPVDDLELPDEPWTEFFNTIGGYDFRDEINLDVLGHLFEKSITELEKLRSSALFEGKTDKVEEYARMPQSVKRKQLGIYYTPPELTERIVRYTVDELIAERWVDLAQRLRPTLSRDEAMRHPPDSADYWREAIEVVRSLKIVDPACGSGAFLFQAYESLEHRYHEAIGRLAALGETDAGPLFDQVPSYILNDNLYGVDLSPEAVEITQLALWIRSATRGKTLATLSRNIVHGNSLVHDPAVHPAGFDWKQRFPEVFNRTLPLPLGEGRGEGGRAAGARTKSGASSANALTPNPSPKGRGGPAQPSPDETGGFDCVIGNPPWERIKLQEREFFSLPAPAIATATNAAKRRKLVAKLESDDPALYQRYQQALESADALITYCRKSEEYPLTGKGDINTYAVFAELASQIVAPQGRVGLLTPSGIASDNTTKDFFAAVAESNRLIRLYDFENKKVFFPEVHASFKFCIINFGGEKVRQKSADYAFFIHGMEELEEKKRHIALSSDDIKLLNPNTRTCPIFRTKRDAEITKAIYRRVPVLIDESRERTGNPWGIAFKTMFHQTNDAELFCEAGDLKKQGCKLHGNRWKKGKKEYLPLYEAKMVQAYDHRAAGVIIDKSNWFRQGQPKDTSAVEHQNPEFLAVPRWWVDESNVQIEDDAAPAFLAFKNVTSPTNTRTMIAAFLPIVAVGNSAPIMLVQKGIAPSQYACLLANLNSYALDYVARQKIGNVNLNFFLIEQFPMFTPDTYDKPCPWEKNRKTTLEKWISERVLKLTCTAEDMLPLAEACGFKAGSFKTPGTYGGKLHKWDPADRANLMAELDAAFFILYGIERDDAEHILSTFSGVNDPNPLLPGTRSTAQHILETYDEFRMRS